MLQSVLLPDGLSWVFQYTTDGNSNLQQITFPTGATINYSWSSQEACYYGVQQVPAVVTQRTLNLNDGSGSQTWNYTYAPSG